MWESKLLASWAKWAQRNAQPESQSRRDEMSADYAELHTVSVAPLAVAASVADSAVELHSL